MAMAKQRQVVSVHIDIAALVWATRGLNTESEWADWGRSFVEALATQSPEKNQFAAQLIGEVVEFRQKEAERIAEIRKVRVQNVPDAVQTVSKKESQSDSKSESQKEAKTKTIKTASPDSEFKSHPWFSDANFLTAWNAWGKARRKSGTKESLNKLRRLSGDSLDSAVQILDESAGNGWTGLFPLKGGSSSPKVNPRQKNKEREYDEQLSL